MEGVHTRARTREGVVDLGEDVGRGALEDRQVRHLVGDGRDDLHGGGARPDDGHALPLCVHMREGGETRQKKRYTRSEMETIDHR